MKHNKSHMKQSIFTCLPFILLLLSACSTNQSPAVTQERDLIELNLEQASHLAALPLACMQTAYPNKPGQTLGSKADLGEPQELHPAFYGCFDWHSAVHAHWSLVKLLKIFPDLEQAPDIRTRLSENMTATNIMSELAYFKRSQENSYERTYGWAWLLKLAEEIHTWDDPLARELEQNLKPLSDLIVERYKDFLPKLLYPIRVGEHPNTAFGLCFAWDYASTMDDSSLLSAIEQRAREFYLADSACPLDWEPGGYDFLSPCLEEIDLMRRILDADEFREWMKAFAPQLLQKDFSLEVGRVADRSDGKLVHLDGLNFSRAWVLYGLAHQYPEYQHLLNLADSHLNSSLPELVGDSYEGGHWLGSFAIYAMQLSR
jgi:Protein of unknown function (DUF2891)